ncbi:MAG: alanine/ornithine racemase family PLP-dependent enzyme [Acidobacteria bacterium]|nr:alanine/ornithine racemase family PLP-dependent enzyme [Acidobacteriota bacterium]
MIDVTTPRIEIDLAKIAHNAEKLKRLYGSRGICVTGVTKVVCGDPRIAGVLVKSGIHTLGDSRITNIRRMREAGIQAQFVLLRTPIPSQAESVVKYADISLNSELSVVKMLSKFAVNNNTAHKVILMVESGDLREGLMPSDLEDAVQEVLLLEGIELAGIGTNLACFGGIKPDEEKMEYLSSLAGDIEERFGLSLEIVSGGNSANYTWFVSGGNTGRINNLRLGESIYLGCETLYRTPIPGLYTDAFMLIAEVIESKIKPSIPYGEVCQDAFGNVPGFKDHGQIRRVILGVGLQDVPVSGLTPLLDIDILGASGDHVIMNAKKEGLKTGDEVVFDLNYGALLSVMTSPYVSKRYVNSI